MNNVPKDPFHTQCWKKLLRDSLLPRSDTTSTVAVDVPALRGWGRGCGCTRFGCRNEECLLRLWGWVWLWAKHGSDLLEGCKGCSFTVSLLLVFIPGKAKRKGSCIKQQRRQTAYFENSSFFIHLISNSPTKQKMFKIFQIWRRMLSWKENPGILHLLFHQKPRIHIDNILNLVLSWYICYPVIRKQMTVPSVNPVTMICLPKFHE